MKAKVLFIVLGLVIISSTRGQNTIDLTFTAVDNATYVQLDSIKIMNRTQVGDTVLYWPDTTLTYEIAPGDLLLYIGYAMGYPVGMQSIGNPVVQFQLSQCYPNPVRDQAVISMSLPSKGPVNITVADIRGRVILNFDRELQEGKHSFRFHPADERVYILTTWWNGITQSIKIFTEGQINGKTCRIEYAGIENGNPVLKQSLAFTDFVVQESGILDMPDNDTTYTFQFATNIPCPETPTVTYDGQVYNTIQIYSQCWLKENLNVGTMIPGSQDQVNNGIIEKYCSYNNTDSCTKYGGLYQWNEMMHYTFQQGAQGICPPGWHLPTDEEWKVLEGATESQYGIGDPEWDSVYWRGFDAGINLKSLSGWGFGGNGTDHFGFSGLPGGYRNNNGYFTLVGYGGDWWTSTWNGYDFYLAYGRNLYYDYPGVCRSFSNYKNLGYSVRCLRDY